MDLHQAVPPLRPGIERGVAHAQRAEDVLLHILFEVQAADRLRHAAGPVDADAVFPAVPLLEAERRLQGGELAGAGGGQAGLRGEAVT